MIANGIAMQVQDRLLALTRFLLVPAIIALAAGIGLVLLGGGGLVDAVGILLLLVSTGFAYVTFRRAASADPNGALLLQIFVISWMIRLAGMALKLYLVGTGGATADALSYHEEGQIVAATLSAGQLPELGQFWGTRFVELVTGLLYFIVGPTFTGGWVIFNLLGLIGMLLHYKAFVTALPQAQPRWFMVLIFLAPSILIWTDSLGKDALMAFFLGLTAYGAAQIYVRGLRPGAIFLAAMGVSGAMLTRPHVAAIAAAALALAVVIRPVRRGAGGVILRLGVVAATIVIGIMIARTSASFINLDDLSVEGIGQFLQTEQAGSQQGDLAFQGSLPTSPQGIAQAVVTVLFRPWPWEAGNAFFLASAFESILLLAIILYRFRDVGAAIRDAVGNGYLAFALVFVALFLFFFATISNFGILVRQRAQMLPFLFVLLSYHRRDGRPRAQAGVSSPQAASVGGGLRAPRA